METKNGRPETEAAYIERLKARVAYLKFQLAGGKSGRVISAVNRDRLNAVHDAMKAATEQLRGLLDETDGDDAGGDNPGQTLIGV